eukprot:gene5681-5629_t
MATDDIVVPSMMRASIHGFMLLALLVIFRCASSAHVLALRWLSDPLTVATHPAAVVCPGRPPHLVVPREYPFTWPCPVDEFIWFNLCLVGALGILAVSCLIALATGVASLRGTILDANKRALIPTLLYI